MVLKRMRKTVDLTGQLTIDSYEGVNGEPNTSLMLDGYRLIDVIQEAWGDTEGRITVRISIDEEQDEEGPEIGPVI